MSIDYYLACRDHEEYIGVSSVGLAGAKMQVDDQKQFAEFIFNHRDCDLFVLGEYDLDGHRIDGIYKRVDGHQ